MNGTDTISNRKRMTPAVSIAFNKQKDRTNRHECGIENIIHHALELLQDKKRRP